MDNDDIDNLLEELDEGYKPSVGRDRNRRNYQDINPQPIKLETNKLIQDEFDSILKVSDSPIGNQYNQTTFITRQRPQTAIIDEQKKQKMADLFQLPKPTVIPTISQPLSTHDENNDMLTIPSRRRGMRQPSINKGQAPRSEINSSQDHQQLEIEKQSEKSDNSHRIKIPDTINNTNSILNQNGNISNVNNNVQVIKLQDEIKQIKNEKEKLDEEIQQLKNQNQKMIEQLEQEKFEKQKILLEKFEIEKSFIKEKETLKLEYERDKQRAIDNAKMENEIIKQQLGDKKQLDHLAEKIKDSAKELELLKNQLYLKNEEQASEKNRQIDIKLNELKDKEIQQERERVYIESEKRRIQNLQDDLSRREQFHQAQIEGDMKSMRNEKQLLQDIKDSLRNLELETKKRLDQESLLLQRQKNEFESQKNELNSQVQQKLRQLDIERQTFEKEKEQQREFKQKNDEIILQKYNDIETQLQKNSAIEIQLVQKQREIDMRDNQLSNQHVELNHKMTLIENERQLLLQKLREISDKEKLYTKEINNVQEFKQVYQKEKEQIERQKIELNQQIVTNQKDKIQIEQEKNNLTVMHRTLSNLRQEITQTNFHKFSQTGTPMRQSIPRPKIEKPKVDNRSNSSQNFDVGNYIKYLKNIDYLH